MSAIARRPAPSAIRAATLWGMNPCGLTRVLLPAFAVGVAVATLAGNDLSGWIAAAATAAVVLVVQAFRGRATACPVDLTEPVPGTAAAPATDDDVPAGAPR